MGVPNQEISPTNEPSWERSDSSASAVTVAGDDGNETLLLQKIRRRVDLRLCTIAGLLCSLNLLDSEIISSASVTTMFKDLDLALGDRYSVSIFIFTLASIAFQLPATLAVRLLGPRIFFSVSTIAFGIITLSTAFIQSWKQMIALRVLLGFAMSGIYPGLSLIISTWYTRQEQQLRFAYLQSGEVLILATGGIVNFGLQRLDGMHGLAGWRWIFLVQGIMATFIGIITYFWMIDFPEEAHKSIWFLSQEETALVIKRIDKDRGDAVPAPFKWTIMLHAGLDPKVYGFAAMFFCQNIVSTALSYFLPIILQGGLGYSTDQAILLAAPPYYYAIVPVIISSLIGDRLYVRGPVIVFNSMTLIAGMGMLGFANSAVVRYVGTFLATGAYVSNWAAITAYWTNNTVGQWKRAYVAALVTAFNGAGGIAGSFIFRQGEAPRYQTAIWTSIGSQILLIAFVGLFTLFLWRHNRTAGRNSTMAESIPDFRYTY